MDTTVVRYGVESGDRLSLIAREFTGDLELWRTIAELNGITDPRKLAVGQVLEIPIALIPEADRDARLAASIPVDADDDAAGTDNAGTRLAALLEGSGTAASAPARVASVPAQQDAARDRSSSESVVVSAVRTREAFDLSPLDAGSSSGAAGSRFVKVVGSYTPKGIYLQPAVQSRVLMRVTPGTVLPLERDVDGWYRVTTSAGPGYLRGADANVVDPRTDKRVDAGSDDAASR